MLAPTFAIAVRPERGGARPVGMHADSFCVSLDAPRSPEGVTFAIRAPHDAHDRFATFNILDGRHVAAEGGAKRRRLVGCKWKAVVSQTGHPRV